MPRWSTRSRVRRPAGRPGHLRWAPPPCERWSTRRRGGTLQPYQGGRRTSSSCPGYRYRVVDALLTNFHLPRSSLLLLVSALAGRGRILEAYEEAVSAVATAFFSFGRCHANPVESATTLVPEAWPMVESLPTEVNYA